jgi:hypothetical protein
VLRESQIMPAPQSAAVVQFQLGRHWCVAE